MSYELHIAHDVGVDHMLWNDNTIGDKNICLFRKWSLKTSPMLNYTYFVLGSKLQNISSKFGFGLIIQQRNVIWTSYCTRYGSRPYALES